MNIKAASIKHEARDDGDIDMTIKLTIDANSFLKIAADLYRYMISMHGHPVDKNMDRLDHEQ